ncbi:GMC oxidoreductase [Brachybacterium sacelli]|uniref:Choline dehydrogenase-like flavoprotein n=1 Tax=Brachybacterium sacelli TaxID=173364 RepID=A0ABS4X6K7_9MICO|nr:GMC family oxidoreductase [Brachybacterium sacelli]MBP2384070.1 choline dehydrogenase-like flavoprotein [Brachybacterium sacelli]
MDHLGAPGTARDDAGAGPSAVLREHVTRSLDPTLATPELVTELLSRLAALDVTAPVGWVETVANHVPGDPASEQAVRAVVGDLLYERGLAPDRVGPDLTPHVRTWSPPASEDTAPLLLDRAAFAAPEELADHYDVIVIGSGAGGGVAAQTLAEDGRRILVVERGSLPSRDRLLTDHLRTPRSALGLFPWSGPGPDAEPREVSLGDAAPRDVVAGQALWGNNAMTLGGGTRVYGAQAWRFGPRDFAMASTYGVPDGSSLADWPLDYEDLEPYYTRIEQLLGVSGGPSSDPWEGSRSAELPLGPLSRSPLGDLLAGAAGRLGLGTQPVPLLINTRERAGRPACVRCSQCVGLDCPVGARAGSHNTTLPAALATGNATLLPGAQAARIEVGPDARARAVELVGERDGRIWHRRIRTELVVLAAGAIESARLLLDSATDDDPRGLGNSADQVGRHLQGHAYGGASALFAEQVVDLRGPGPDISTADLRHGNDGVIGGGILADEFVPTPADTQRALRRNGLVDPETPVGSPAMERAMLRLGTVVGPVQEVTTADSRVRLDRTRRDRFGRALVHLSGSLHPEDLRGRDLLSSRAAEWLREAGALEVRPMPPLEGLTPPSNGQHQAGTCRMGTDPATSVVTPEGRLWGHENIVVADGSTHVTNGGANPVLTIYANALRISEGVMLRS